MRTIKLKDIYFCFNSNDCKIKSLKELKEEDIMSLINSEYFVIFKEADFTLKATIKSFEVLATDGLKGIRHLERNKPVIRWRKFISYFERYGMIQVVGKGYDWTYKTRSFVDYLKAWYEVVYGENYG